MAVAAGDLVSPPLQPHQPVQRPLLHHPRQRNEKLRYLSRTGCRLLCLQLGTKFSNVYITAMQSCCTSSPHSPPSLRPSQSLSLTPASLSLTTTSLSLAPPSLSLAPPSLSLAPAESTPTFYRVSGAVVGGGADCTGRTISEEIVKCVARASVWC
jgi:hypothetical protein